MASSSLQKYWMARVHMHGRGRWDGLLVLEKRWIWLSRQSAWTEDDGERFPAA